MIIMEMIISMKPLTNEAPLSWRWICIIIKEAMCMTINFITHTSLLSIYELKIPIWRSFSLLLEFHNHVQWHLDLHDLDYDFQNKFTPLCKFDRIMDHLQCLSMIELCLYVFPWLVEVYNHIWIVDHLIDIGKFTIQLWIYTIPIRMII